MIYADQVFAPLDRDLTLERIAGGNETEVYRTDDQHYVVKLKSHLGGTTREALARARADRAAAEQFIACLGAGHTIPSYYVIARDNTGRAQALVVQPYLAGARQLFDIDYQALSDDERASIAAQLRRNHRSLAQLLPRDSQYARPVWTRQRQRRRTGTPEYAPDAAAATMELLGRA